MVVRAGNGHDGRMNETHDRPDEDRPITTKDPEQDGFHADRLRTLADMRRSRDDRVVAGVCSGAAKYLNVDPVVIRVVIAVLTFVGLAGLILYLAAWFLLPSEDEESIAASWFNLDKNEEQVRVVGLVGAAVLATLAIVGEDQWAWWGIPWAVIPLAFLYWLFVVRRRHRSRDDHDADPTHPDAPTTAQVLAADDTEETLVDPTDSTESTSPPTIERGATKRHGSSVLTALTLSATAIAVAITVLVAQSTDVSWTTYLAVALGVVAVGLLIGMFFGRPGPLIVVGLILAVTLVIASLLPSAGMGEKVVNPVTAANVDGGYKHGFGPLRVDLSQVRDPEQLLGSTIDLENGAGDITVTVPDDLNVAVDAQVDAGEIRAFGRKANGTDVTLVEPAAEPSEPTLTLRIRQTFGGIEVIER
jgi:phage shock protein PspC (stress-responsive transcriptional regulator)